MKTSRITFGIAAIAAIALAQSASAALLAGFYAFNGEKAIPNPGTGISLERPEIWMPGITAWMQSPVQASQGSGGSFDGDYGNFMSTTAPIPGYLGAAQDPSKNLSIGDGSATIRTIEGSFASTLTFYFRNDSPFALELTSLCFDIADVSTTLIEKNRYTLQQLAGTTANTLVSNRLVGIATDNLSYVDQMITLNYILPAGGTVGYEFTADITPGAQYPEDTVYLDNLALFTSAIPEPGSVLGLGCVLASGLLLRSRRRI